MLIVLAITAVVVSTGTLAIAALMLRRLAEMSRFDLAPLATRFDLLSQELARVREAQLNDARAQRTELTDVLERTREVLDSRLRFLREDNSKELDKIRGSVDVMRDAVDTRLKTLQNENSKKLDEMRQTVDEKLQGTLEKRLGESFRMVSERLEQVHKGLGEMQSLATGVGDLKKVLTNVKARGTWGEVQLGGLLEQMLTAEQFDRNVPVTGTGERVEFAIRMPGSFDGPVWLPIDSKFPQEDYQRLVDASEAGDAIAVDAAAKAIEINMRASAKKIRDKYIAPPRTTEFGVLFLPTEGLYAEVLRRPGLADALQREFRVMVAGPTTLCAMLNSLQMGFQTLAIQERSSEVWRLLGDVKTEFDKFSCVLDKIKRKLVEASNTVDDAARRTRVMNRKLRDVEGGDGLLLDEADEDTEFQRVLIAGR
jgi:DNA recombination protein RmuC